MSEDEDAWQFTDGERVSPDDPIVHGNRWRRERDEARAERDRYRDALNEIASDLGHPGDPAWREAMEALGRDVEAAERAWQD